MAEKIIQENVAKAAQDYSCIFGANKNLYRTIPSMIDGLRPGKRRIFWCWWEREGKPTNTKKETLKKLKFTKVQTLASAAMLYHPHGDTSNEEIITGEGQYWNNNVCTVIPQGSYGSIRGDKPASGRYCECKMSEYLIDCFFEDFYKYCVPMKESFNGESMEPLYLPAKYPCALFNPQLSGIGYGLASNIISFNIKEVLEATIKLIKNPKAKIMLIPDIPTGADIVDDGHFKEINKTGNGKLTMRATPSIDYKKNIITFTSVPLQISTMQIIDKWITKKENGEFNEINEIKDYTKNGEVDLRFLLKHDANPDKVLDKLYKSGIGLKVTAPVSLKMIDDFREKTYGVKEFLLEWLEYRKDAVRSMVSNDLMQTMEKQHLNKVLLFVLNKDNAEKTIKICKQASSRKDTINRLMNEYKITSLQAGTIADMRLYNFNKDAYQRYKDEKIELEDNVKTLSKTLESEDLIDEFIIKQLKEGIKKYGKPRKSVVIRDDEETKKKEIPDYSCLISISDNGLIKKVNLKKFNTIGNISNKNIENFSILEINNRMDLLIIDSEGTASRIPVSSIPDMSNKDNGVLINRFFKCSGKIIGCMKIPDIKFLKAKNNDITVVLITKNGYMKRIMLSEYKGLSSPRKSIILNEGDEVVSAVFTPKDCKDDLIISTNTGYGARITVNDIPILTKASKGKRCIGEIDNGYIVNCDILDSKAKEIFYITSRGNAKITQTKYFPKMKKKDPLLQLITLSATETLIRTCGVDHKKDSVVVYYKNKEPEEVELKDLTMSTRKAKGTKLVRVPKGDSIVSTKIIHK